LCPEIFDTVCFKQIIKTKSLPPHKFILLAPQTKPGYGPALTYTINNLGLYADKHGKFDAGGE